jgi:hypothetical protein
MKFNVGDLVEVIDKMGAAVLTSENMAIVGTVKEVTPFNTTVCFSSLSTPTTYFEYITAPGCLKHAHLSIGDIVEVIQSDNYKGKLGKVEKLYAIPDSIRVGFADNTRLYFKHDQLRFVRREPPPAEPEPQVLTFASQQEVWEYLVAGGMVQTNKGVYRMVDKQLSLLSPPNSWVSGANCNFNDYRQVIKYLEEANSPQKVNWYDNIPEQGILCWISDGNKSPTYKQKGTLPGIVLQYKKDSPMPFRVNGCSRKYAIPLTQEEANNLIYQPESLNGKS